MIKIMNAFRNLSIRIKIGFVFALIMLFAILNFVVFFIEQSNEKSLEIDIAGRNRMLSQNIAFYAEMVSKGHKDDIARMANTIELMDVSLKALKSGGTTKKDNETVEVRALGNEYNNNFTEIDNIWEPFKKNALQLGNNPNDNSAIQFIEDNSDKLLKSCNSLVTALVNNTHRNMAFTNTIFIVFLIFNIIVKRF